MKKERIFWGVFFILGAIFILVAKLGFMQGVGIWSLIMTVFWLALLIKCIMKVYFFGIFFSLAFLVIIYAGPLDTVMPWKETFTLQSITPWPVLGAALLLSVGCTMIFPKKHKTILGMHFSGDETIIDEKDEDRCECFVRFGASTKYINSDAFESAFLEANFGGLKVFFDNAVMKGTEAYVTMNNNFAGMELYVPKTWTVVNQIKNSFAGVDEKGHCMPDGVHTLYLKGENCFGGITIIYV